MKPFFYFKQAERQGIVFLILLIVVAFIWPKVYGHYWQKDDYFQLTFQPLDTIPIHSTFARDYKKTKVSYPRPDTLFSFDPNLVDAEALTRLGLPKNVAATLINFRNKGGKFYQKKDLLKVYGVEESWYSLVADYVQLPDHSKRHKTNSPDKTNASPKVSQQIYIKINQADAEEWSKLRGIGPVLSDRIVKFRDKLGGFYDIDQVGQTYGLADSVFQSIKQQLVLEVELKAFKINELSTKELASHPYLSWKEAQIINSYRAMHGPFSDSSALTKVQVLNHGNLRRLMPYIDYCSPCNPE